MTASPSTPAPAGAAEELPQQLARLLRQALPTPADGRLFMTPEQQDAALPAAVLLALVCRADGPAILLTRRTEHLQNHAGQISFAGGRTDAGDTSPVDTALREAAEEIGLAPERVAVLGKLPEFFIPTGYRVTPVLAWLAEEPALRADPEEVAEIFYLPAQLGLDPEAWRIEEFERGGRLLRVWVMDYQGRRIWGATAGILVWLAQWLATQGLRI